MEKSLSLNFAKFLKIKSWKSAILDCATILKDFQKRFSTKRGRNFWKICIFEFQR
jgi:hypothetical protein